MRSLHQTRTPKARTCTSSITVELARNVTTQVHCKRAADHRQPHSDGAVFWTIRDVRITRRKLARAG